MEGDKNTKLIKLYDEAISRMHVKIEDLMQIKKDVTNLTRSRLGFICDENSSKYERRLFTKCDVSDFFAELDAEIKIHESKITELEELRVKAKEQPEPSSSSDDADAEEPVRPENVCPPNAAAGAKRKYKNRKNSNQTTDHKPANNNQAQQKTTTTQKFYGQRQNKPNHYGRYENQYFHHYHNRHFYNFDHFVHHHNRFGGYNGGMPFYGNRPGPFYPPYNRNVYCPPRMIGNMFVPNQFRRNHAMNNYRQRNLTYL